MKNAHTRIGIIEFVAERKKGPSYVRAYYNCFAKDDDQAHMVSFFGNDSEVSAVQAAIQANLPLTAIDPKGNRHVIRLGEKAETSHRANIPVPDRPRPLRHIVALSKSASENGSGGSVYLFDREPGLIWATLVSTLGLPASPDWAFPAIKWLSDSGKLIEMEGYACEPVVVKTTREELLAWIGEGVRTKALLFPERDGPIFWPQYDFTNIIAPVVQDDEDEDEETGGALVAAA